MNRRQLRQGALDGRKLVHTSFWLDPWTRRCIREYAQGGQVSQSLLLNAIVMDFWLKSLPPKEQTKPEYVRCQRFVRFVFDRLR